MDVVKSVSIATVSRVAIETVAIETVAKEYMNNIISLLVKCMEVIEILSMTTVSRDTNPGNGC